MIGRVRAPSCIRHASRLLSTIGSGHEPSIGESGAYQDEAIALAKWHKFNEDGVRAFAQGNVTKAQDFLSIAIELRRDSKDVCYATSLANMAGVKRRLGETELAKDLLENALSILEKKPMTDKLAPILGNALVEYSEVLVDEALEQHSHDSVEEKKELLEEALKCLKKGSTLLDSAQVGLTSQARSKFSLAKCLQALGRFEEAEAILLQCLDLAKQVHGDKHWNTAETFRSLGACYIQMREWDKAQKCYFDCMSILDELKSPHLAVVLGELVSGLEASGHVPPELVKDVLKVMSGESEPAAEK